jgi:hypothetical protein
MKVKSMRGKTIDMSRLMAQNERTPAISGLGGARLNARGDRLNANGGIAKSREAVAREYHAVAPRTVKQVSFRDLSNEIFETPTQAVSAIEKRNAEAKAAEAQKPAAAPAQETVRKQRKIEDKED